MTQLLRFRAHASFVFGLIVAGALCSCTKKDLTTAPVDAGGASAATTRALRSKVDTIVVIYAENRAFDNLYGNFPGARNLSEVIDRRGKPLSSYQPQKDRNGTVLPVLAADVGRRDGGRRHARGHAAAKRRLAECAVFHRAWVYRAIASHSVNRHRDA